MKSVAVFGASGVLGKCVLEAVLEKGPNVRALVRDPAQIPKMCRERVQVVTGDVSNVVDVQATLEGQDAAIVLLEGCYCAENSTPVSEGWKNIIAILEALNINVSSFFLAAHNSNTTDTVSPPMLDIDSERQKILKALDASGLHWIVAKTDQVVDQASTGYSVIRVTLTRNFGNSGISYRDLAHFLVDSLSMPEHYQKVVTVCSNPRRQVFKDVLNFDS